jgi:hypothetical protein
MKKSRYERNLKEPIITTSEKNDIKGGSPRLKEQQRNQNRQNKGDSSKTPLRNINLRE